MWKVVVIERETQKVVAQFTYHHENIAEKAQRGVDTNLDPERFYTEIVFEPGK